MPADLHKIFPHPRRLKLVFLTCLCLWGIIGLSSAASGGGQWRTLDQGLSYRAVSLPSSLAKMHQVRLDPRLYKFSLTTTGSGKYPTATLSTLRKRAQAPVAINGGYFGESNEPLGYQKSGNHILNGQIASGNAFTGIIVLSRWHSRLFHREDFYPQQADVILQAGPRLISDRSAITGLSSKSTRLSGIAIDYWGNIVLYSTDLSGFLTLKQCQEILLGELSRGGIKPVYALNLDGGRSAGLSIDTPSLKLEKPSVSLLPVALTAKRR